ncbi:hypothetical protein LCI18_009156 [Fusarium solani-melongenae]|uniref:Uncharacterized protein n=1 Tax=Fusarium solani subsp. cucurbitae TaxID=2747967 RepID=A0ACD3ZAS0_FUSSC|nr:hypothetical protein LCI18_009156 [Fusarium solani-melongenae]
MLYLLLAECVYINNVSGAVILELIRRAPASQGEGLRELLAKYVHDNPRPYFALSERTMWNSAFFLLFNCPYFVLTTEDVEDHRTISKASKNMRSRDSLDFLYLFHYLKGARRIRDLESQAETRYKYLHDVVSSAVITGHNDDYWTCLFFNEDLCLEAQNQRLQAEIEFDEDGGTTDPITMTEETSASLKPRIYGLQILVSLLDTIFNEQSMIQARFRESLNLFTRGPDIGREDIRQWVKSFKSVLTKVIDRNSWLLRELDIFLEKDVGLGDDGIPSGRYFQSLKRDPVVKKLLGELAELRRQLQDVNRELEQQRSACDDFRQEQMDDQLEEENSRSDQGQKLQQLIKKIAALQIVLTLLGLAVQLFDAWDRSYLVAFIIVVALIGIINIVALVLLFLKRPMIHRYRRLRRQDASRSEAHEV